MTINKKYILCCIPFSQHSPTPPIMEVLFGCTPSWYPPCLPSGWLKRGKHSQPVNLLPDRLKESTWAHTNPKLWFKTYTENTVAPHTWPITKKFYIFLTNTI